MDSLENRAKLYDTLNDTDKHQFLKQAYHEHHMSYGAIGKLCNKHGNSIRRDAMKLGIQGRDKSEAQALALKVGNTPHPTKGKKRSENVKIKISEGVSKDWDQLSDKERARRKKTAKERWESMSSAEREEFQQKAGTAIRKAAKEGSKLEKFLYQELRDRDYQVVFHQTKFVRNENLHLDLLLPILKVAIEVDGPSHFLPIWGEDALEKNRRADADKDGLLLSSGYCVIRVQQHRALSAKYKRDILDALLAQLDSIAEKFPEVGNRHFTIGEV